MLDRQEVGSSNLPVLTPEKTPAEMRVSFVIRRPIIVVIPGSTGDPHRLLAIPCGAGNVPRTGPLPSVMKPPEAAYYGGDAISPNCSTTTGLSRPYRAGQRAARAEIDGWCTTFCLSRPCRRHDRAAVWQRSGKEYP